MVTDLRDWLQHVASMGELQSVQGAELDLEVGTISELNTRRKGPALLFDSFAGYPKGYRLLTGSLITPSRLSFTLGLGATNSDGDLVHELAMKTEEWRKRVDDFPPEEVSKGPVLENVFLGDDLNVEKFPVPKWHEHDGGRYIGTGCAVITRDPETGQVNVGTYRSMLTGHRDKVTLWIVPGRHGWLHRSKYFASDRPCPVVISYGHEPLLFMLAATEIPTSVSELNYMGAIKGARVPVVNGTVTGLPIPAASEIAVEGWVTPDITGLDGPFGEWLGYYAGGQHAVPLVQIKALYHRDDPIILGAPPAKPPYDYSYFRSVLKSALLKNALDGAGVPDVRAVWCHEAGAGRLFNVIAIKQRYLGHARQAGLAAISCREGASGNRYTIVVDEDIDPTDTWDVLWAVSTRSDPERDIDIVRRCWTTPSDPMAGSARQTPYSSRAIIDACKPFESLAEFPMVNESSPTLKDRVLDKWRGILF